uniref:N-acetyltransferase domain-containing protein n=1 Tax=Ditylenchus dipsaci TaxID=166011 RepID=A0A915DGE2_9BILA
MGSLQYDIKGQTYHIGHLKTSDAYQNRKVGTVIMDEFLGYAEKSGAQQVTLSVRNSNTYAVKLYRNFGFVEDNNVDEENRYPGWLNMVKKFDSS